MGIKENVDKTKHMVMSRDPNEGRSHNTKIDNNSFEMVEQFKYLGKTLTNQNSEENKSILESGNTCYHLVQNLVFYFVIQKFKD